MLDLQLLSGHRFSKLIYYKSHRDLMCILFINVLCNEKHLIYR